MEVHNWRGETPPPGPSPDEVHVGRGGKEAGELKYLFAHFARNEYGNGEKKYELGSDCLRR